MFSEKLLDLLLSSTNVALSPYDNRSIAAALLTVFLLFSIGSQENEEWMNGGERNKKIGDG